MKLIAIAVFLLSTIINQASAVNFNFAATQFYELMRPLLGINSGELLKFNSFVKYRMKTSTGFTIECVSQLESIQLHQIEITFPDKFTRQELQMVGEYLKASNYANSRIEIFNYIEIEGQLKLKLNYIDTDVQVNEDAFILTLASLSEIFQIFHLAKADHATFSKLLSSQLINTQYFIQRVGETNRLLH